MELRYNKSRGKWEIVDSFQGVLKRTSTKKEAENKLRGEAQTRANVMGQVVPVVVRFMDGRVDRSFEVEPRN